MESSSTWLINIHWRKTKEGILIWFNYNICLINNGSAWLNCRNIDQKNNAKSCSTSESMIQELCLYSAKQEVWWNYTNSEIMPYHQPSPLPSPFLPCSCYILQELFPPTPHTICTFIHYPTCPYYLLTIHIPSTQSYNITSYIRQGYIKPYWRQIYDPSMTLILLRLCVQARMSLELCGMQRRHAGASPTTLP